MATAHGVLYEWTDVRLALIVLDVFVHSQQQFVVGSDLDVGSLTTAMMTGHHAFSMQHAS